jgi:predicted permease
MGKKKKECLGVVLSVSSYVSVILNQVLLMLILVVAGFISFKTRIITTEGNKHLSNLLVLLVNPVVIFVSYQRDFSPDLLVGLAEAFGLSLLGFGIAMVVAYLCLRKGGKFDEVIERFSVIYSNCGFMGIPLVMAMLGTEGVFYLTAVMTAFNLLVWTHGMIMFTGAGQFNIKGLLRALCSPAILAVPVGLACFLLQWRVPQVLYEALEYVSNMNTPLAMLIAGATVAQTNLLKAFARGRIYYVSVLKLLVAPILIVLALSIFPLPQIVLLTVAVAMASPTATMGTLFAIRYERNAVYASELFAVTTILSAISLPVVVYIAERLL